MILTFIFNHTKLFEWDIVLFPFDIDSNLIIYVLLLADLTHFIAILF